MSKIIKFQVEKEMMPIVALEFLSDKIYPFSQMRLLNQMQLRTPTLKNNVYLEFIQPNPIVLECFISIEAIPSSTAIDFFNIAIPSSTAIDFFNIAKTNNKELNDWLECKILDAFSKKFEQIL